MKQYPMEGEKIAYLSDEEMKRTVARWYKPKWMARFIGGYCIPSMKLIYIKESRKGDMKLLNHERGHLRGYGHTWLPTLMFPSWVGRLFNRYGRKGK
jgi:hypothetical protein